MSTTETQSGEVVPLSSASANLGLKAEANADAEPQAEANPKAKSKWKTPLGIVIFLSVSVFAYCAPSGTFGRLGLEFTGIVYDQDTMQPLEGAFALAVYEETGGSMAGSGNWCVKTKGMYTGKDGRFHFPVEGLGGGSPASVFAIKPDYYLFERVTPSQSAQRWRTKAMYTDRHVYLKKQDKEKPEFGYGFRHCERPTSPIDLVDALQFIKITHSEYVKYKRDAMVINDAAEDIANIEKILAKQSTRIPK